MRRLASAVGLLLLLGAAPVPAQEAELARALDRVAGLWERGDVATVVLLASHSGVALELDGDEVGPLGSRQTAAALRRLLTGRETASLLIRSARVVGGRPPRAFGELTWLFRARGTTIPERATVFLAFVWEDGGWKLTQIRLLP